MRLCLISTKQVVCFEGAPGSHTAEAEFGLACAPIQQRAALGLPDGDSDPYFYDCHGDSGDWEVCPCVLVLPMPTLLCECAVASQRSMRQPSATWQENEEPPELTAARHRLVQLQLQKKVGQADMQPPLAEAAAPGLHPQTAGAQAAVPWRKCSFCHQGVTLIRVHHGMTSRGRATGGCGAATQTSRA